MKDKLESQKKNCGFGGCIEGENRTRPHRIIMIRCNIDTVVPVWSIYYNGIEKADTSEGSGISNRYGTSNRDGILEEGDIGIGRTKI